MCWPTSSRRSACAAGSASGSWASARASSATPPSGARCAATTPCTRRARAPVGFCFRVGGADEAAAAAEGPCGRPPASRPGTALTRKGLTCKRPQGSRLPASRSPALAADARPLHPLPPTLPPADRRGRASTAPPSTRCRRSSRRRRRHMPRRRSEGAAAGCFARGAAPPTICRQLSGARGAPPLPYTSLSLYI